jgi:hypothetical protein
MQSPTEDLRRRLEGSNPRSQAAWIAFVFFYAILANLPFWVASRWLGLLPLGWFCLEYAALGVMALFLPRILSAALLVLMIGADLLSAVCKTYFLVPSECFANFGSLHEVSPQRLLAVTTVFSLAVLIFAVAANLPIARLPRVQRTCAAACLAAFLVVNTAIDCISMKRGAGFLPHVIQPSARDSMKFSQFDKVWMSRYPMIRLIRIQNGLRGIGPSQANAIDSRPISSAAAVAIRVAGLEQSRDFEQAPNLVLVLSESWGFALDSSLRYSLVRDYLQPELLARYEVSQGTVPFYGPTIAGEARELCQSRMGNQISSASNLSSCIPDRMASLGYRSVALHGMDGHMYHRSTWYRTIGFQEQWFRDRFRLNSLPDCTGAFTGTCDASIANWIADRLHKPEANPAFVYWVTLNAHLPVPVPAMLSSPASCSLIPHLADEPALCSWYQLVSDLQDSVSRLALSSLGRPTIFVIVGDHAPPFANPELRSQFSISVVPYIILAPRAGTGQSAPASRLQVATAVPPPR